MGTRNKRTVEVTAVIGVYLLFLAVGLYSGQMTIDLEMVGPLNGARLHSSPVELAAKVTIRATPVSDVKVRFTIFRWEKGESTFEIHTNAQGVAQLVLPASSGNYSWRVSVTKQGYPETLSHWVSFSIELSLVVDGLLPSSQFLAVSPVSFKAKVCDLKGRPVDSARVTFYVDSVVVGSSLTDPKGIAKLSVPVPLGKHVWFASATRDGEGGVSRSVDFLVGNV